MSPTVIVILCAYAFFAIPLGIVLGKELKASRKQNSWRIE